MGDDNVSWEFFSRKNIRRLQKIEYEKQYDFYIKYIDPTGEFGLAELELPYDELKALYLECTLLKVEAEE
ncbi:MAG: hypothetical protein CBE45_000445 [Thiotrichales bacterium TMED285]|nr:MAG: hypothetical protein CBE45_000445 [Thiotrichales bacterium TMED285]